MSSLTPARSTLWLACAVLLMSAATANAQSCSCGDEVAFGSCRIQDLSRTSTPQTPTPGPALIVENNSETFLIIADLFSGTSTIYNANSFLTVIPAQFPNPRGSVTTSGLARVGDRLYWAVNGGLVVSEFPDLEVTVTSAIARTDGLVEFTDATDESGAAIEYSVDLATLADLVIGDEDFAGELGGIAYHAERNTLWGVDIVNDIVFEMTLEGELVIENGMPVHFRNPAVSAASPKAFGNAISYVSSEKGSFFDLLVGTVSEGRATRVERVSADAGSIGETVGLGYSLYDGLLPDDDTTFPTGLAFWNDSCNGDTKSEFVIAYSPATAPSHSFVQVSLGSVPVSGLNSFDCAFDGQASVNLSWSTDSDEFDSIEIFRAPLGDLTDESSVLTSSDSTGSATDSSFSVPVDGAYRYRAVVVSAAGISSPSSFCSTTVGSGSVSETLDVATRTGGLRNLRALSIVGSMIYTVDADTNATFRFQADSLQFDSEITSPISRVAGTTTGLTHDIVNDRLMWLGAVDGVAVVQASDLDGANEGPRRTVQVPGAFGQAAPLGDISYDRVTANYWVSDPIHNAIYSINENGELIEDSFLMDPTGEGVGHGIAMSAGDDSTVVLDIYSNGSIVRQSYDRSGMSAEFVQSIPVAHLTNSTNPGGIDSGSRDSGDVLIHITADTNQLYVFSLNAAVLDSLPFQRGDVNNDGQLNISDPSYLLSWLFKGGDAPACADAADIDDLGDVNMTDAIGIFNYLFLEGTMPAAPFGSCGFDSSADDLECEANLCTE